jgi:hypothetical protein
MSFSSSFCLTNIGSLTSSTSVDIYSNVDNYTTPFQTGILLSDITGTNCPYVLNGIPDGTTTLQINDINSSCCVTISISPNTICDICDLGFDVYSSSTISVIVAGNLTGSCNANITDYLINWYDVSDLNTPVFTSGRGTEFAPYGFPHPLTGLQSVPVLSGEYVPVIQKIKLNGINYSNQLETGFVQASLNCFDNVTVQVESFTCSNGDQTGNYDHLIRYSGASVDLTPPSVQSTFELSPTTNYIAWKFNGFDVPDSFKLTYYGSFYNNTPIVLEYWTIGSDITVENLSLVPRQLGTPTFGTGFNKVTCLTGLTRSTNDFLVIEITPNPLNNVTNYSLLFTCLEEFDCDTCFNTYLNTPYKILGSTISGQTLSCNRVNIYFKVSGCGFNDLTLTDTYKYVYTSLNRSPFTVPGDVGYNGQPIDQQVTLSNSTSGCNTNGNQLQVACSPTLSSTITFTKNNSGPGGQGNIYITFNNLNDFNAYYNSYLTQMSNAAPISNDNTTFNYYKYLQLQSPDYRYIPNPENLGCGDGSGRVEYLIHTSSIVTTGFTSGLYTLNITMPTITSGMTFTNCQSGCEYYMNDIVGDVNTSSLTTGNNQSYTNNKGSRVTQPFYRYTRLSFYTGGTRTQDSWSREETSLFFNATYPMSGSNYNLAPSLYSQLCPLYGERFTDFYTGAVRKYQFFYRITSTNPNNLLDFTIEASPIINGAPTYTYVLIYQVQNGTVIYSDPNYII